jgi:hypothetical protein
VLVLWILGAESAPARGETPSPAAHLASGNEASEYWDVTALFDSGHRIFARFSISNEGPGDRTGYALGQIVFPDGRVVPFQNGRTEGSWKLSNDRLRMEIGSSVLDLHGPEAHFEVDKNKLGIKFFLDFPLSQDRMRTWGGSPAGYRHDLLALGESVRGTIWVRDVAALPVPVEGRVTLTHVSMAKSEPRLARRRVEPLLLPPGDAPAVYALDLTSAKGGRRGWMVVRRPDGVWLETDRFRLEGEGRAVGSDADYPIPAALAVAPEEAPGVVQGRIETRARILSHDPLSIAPRPFRWLLSFRTEPRQIQVGARWALEWTGDDQELALQGNGVTSFYFLNPMPSSVRAADP